MNKAKGTIGTKEFFAIIVLTIGTKLADDTPSILFTKMENAAWMAPIIFAILLILPLYFLTTIISSHPGKNLIEIILDLFGKYFGFFVLFILWIIQTFALVIDSAIYTDIIGTMYFSSTPPVVLYSILIGVAAFGAIKGIEHISSFAWIIFISIMFSATTAITLILYQGQIDFIYPIFGPGVWEIVKNSTSYVSIIGDFIFLSMVASHLKSAKVYKKAVWLSLIFVTILLTLTLLGCVLLFDLNGVKKLNYPFHEAIRYIEFGFLTNTETLFFPFWLLTTFTRFSFYLYMSAVLFVTLFKIQQFKHMIPILATLVVFVGMLSETPTFTNFFMRETLLQLATPIVFLLPFLLWVRTKMKGGSKRDQANPTK